MLANEIKEKFGTSDHDMIEFEIETKEKPTSWKTYYREYRKADFNKIREELQSEGYRNEPSMGVDESWNNLKLKLEKVVEKNIPLKERSMGKPPKPMWWNRKINRLRKNRLKWWSRYREKKTQRNEEKYLHCQREVTKEIQNQ